ncbi:hypothetical protein Q9233_017727 [Columba guinea]|nr:hypothetical protein Q9233_017727 [Columba guinea]
MSLLAAGLRALRGTLSPVLGAARPMSSLEPSLGSLGSLRVTRPREHILHVELNRPHKRNAMDAAFWRWTDRGQMGRQGAGGQGSQFQESFTALEKCPKPVIAAIHGACVGAGVDLISACDIRFCSQDAWFQVKEVDIGLAADVGTLQRLPKIVGSQSLVNELAFTARKMMAPEAQSCGLVSRVFADKEALLAGALEVAVAIAARSPVAVQGTKVNLLFSRDHSVPEGLRYVATWNMAMLQTEDILKSVQASMDKKGPEDVPFAKL